MNLTRTTKNVSAAIVGGIAAYGSYWHQVAVAAIAGERAELAHLIPLSVDGVMVVASVVMVDDRAAGRKPRISAKIGFAIGIVASIAANVSSAQPTWLGRAVAAWPALALLLVVEMLSRRGRQVEIPAAAPTSPGMPPVDAEPPEVLAYRQAADRLRRASRLEALNGGASG